MKRIAPARMARLGAVAAASALALSLLTACGGDGTEGSEGAYKIGVLQLTEHAALDQANEGFVAALDDSGIDYEIDQQNAQNDQSACQTIASKLVSDGDDLILAIGTPAAQAVVGATTETPVVATAITDFAASGLVAENDAPGGNVTGTSDLTPVAEQIDLLHTLVPDAQNVGLLYCTSEANSKIQIDLAKKALDELGIGYTEYTVSSSNEIQSVTESMVGSVDVIYTPTDNTIASGMSQIAAIANEAGVPTICGEKAHVEAGGLASYSIDYYQLGYKAGEMALRILRDGENPAEMPVEQLAVEDCELVVNDETAATLGIDTSVLDEKSAE